MYTTHTCRLYFERENNQALKCCNGNNDPFSGLPMVIQTSMQSAYAVEKIDTIKVSPREIKITLPDGSKVTVYHLFVVYTQKQQHQQQEVPTDKAYVCQGFPLDPATGQIPPDSDLPLLPS